MNNVITPDAASSDDLIRELKVLAAEKEDVRRELAVTAEQLAVTAKEKEDVRRELAVTAAELAATALKKEDVRRELAVTAEQLAVTAEQLAVTAKEKEDVRRKLAVTAGELAVYTKGLEVKGVEQTLELVGRVRELETMNSMMVGRELKMAAMKEEIERLRKGKAV